MQWLIPVVMGLWAIWTWSQEQERERTNERARLAALYVNPFLSACEDLQSRIYNILELDGLGTLQKRYPDGAYAEETLYLIVRYFGWAAAMNRYSPYAQDPVVTRLAEAVRKAFATVDAEFLVGPFNFFHPEQKALGKMVMSRMEGQHGIEFDTISSYEFKERLASPPLSDSQAVHQSLEALRARGLQPLRRRTEEVLKPEGAPRSGWIPPGASDCGGHAVVGDGCRTGRSEPSPVFR